MSIVDTLGYHVDLKWLNTGGTVKYLFPTNTIEDVIVDNYGNTLNGFMPVSVTSPTTLSGNPIRFVQKSLSTMTDAVAALILA